MLSPSALYVSNASWCEDDTVETVMSLIGKASALYYAQDVGAMMYKCIMLKVLSEWER